MSTWAFHFEHLRLEGGRSFCRQPTYQISIDLSIQLVQELNTSISNCDNVVNFFSFSPFFQAHAIEEALRKDRCSAEKGTESTKKGEGEQQHKEKLSPLPFELIINAAQ